jgi:hypothetical protein
VRVTGEVFVNYRGVDSRSYGAPSAASGSGGAGPTEAELLADIAGLSRCQFRWLRHREVTTDLALLRADLAADPELA